MLKPFFCYYGGKWRAAPKYPQPKYDLVIEPFAGGAGYATRHYNKDVLLCEADPMLAELWRWLIDATPKDVLSLPIKVDHVDDFDIPPGAKSLIGFWLNKATTRPSKTPSKWAREGTRPKSFWGREIRDRVAQQVPQIKHWVMREGTYEDAGNHKATWFIDPPYNNAAGKLYRVRFSRYDQLAAWCRSRPGQVIVCENEGAAWLPFQFLGGFKSTEGKRGKKRSNEAVYTQ